MTLVKNPSCNVPVVERVVLDSVEGAKMMVEAGAEMTFLLPRDQSSHFPELFSRLELQSNSLGVDSFGVSVTTMEEVFLKVSKGDGQDVQEPPMLPVRIVPQDGVEVIREPSLKPQVKLLSGFPHLLQQFKAMFIKR